VNFLADNSISLESTVSLDQLTKLADYGTLPQDNVLRPSVDTTMKS
jgi:hypothetical protein